ncbi:MAG: putative secreted protein [Solirubrobacterales bacterium]|nr:putative secreted protein [Solirubrobacterales bacterium]
MGDTQPLANGNTFVGWGSAPYFTEYSASGKLLLEAEFPGSDLSYRTMVEPWVGVPLAAPVGAARKTNGGTTVYASWNGSTQVVSWRVLGGPSAGSMAVVGNAAKAGFETAIPMSQGYASYEVQALDASGRVIGTSRAFPGSTR